MKRKVSAVLQECQVGYVAVVWQPCFAVPVLVSLCELHLASNTVKVEGSN